MRTLGANRTLSALNALSTCVALYALSTLRSDRTGVAFIPFHALKTLRSDRTCISFIPFHALNTLRSERAGISFVPFQALNTLRSSRSGISVSSLSACRACVTLSTLPALRSRQTNWTSRPVCSRVTFQALRSRFALRSGYAWSTDHGGVGRAGVVYKIAEQIHRYISLRPGNRD